MAQRIFLLVLCLMLVGCGNPMQQASSLKEEGRFQEAADLYQQVFIKNYQHENIARKAKALNATIALYSCQMELHQYAEAAETMTNTIQLSEIINEEFPDFTSMSTMARWYEFRAAAHWHANDNEKFEHDCLRSFQLQQIHEQQMQEVKRQEENIRKNPVSFKSSGGSE